MAVEVFARTPGQNAKIEQRIVRAIEIIVQKVWGDRLLMLAILGAGKQLWLDRFQRNMKNGVGIPPSATAGLRDIGEQLYIDFAARYRHGPHANREMTMDAAGHLEDIGVSARKELDLELLAGELNAHERRKRRTAILDGWQSLSVGLRH